MPNNENSIFNITSEQEFLEQSLHLFHFQYERNKVYKRWVNLLKINPEKISRLEQIPFLPIEFFKKHKIISSPITPKTIEFTSSATTSQTPSIHYINDVSVYKTSFLKGFKRFYGSPEDYCILALLPNYLQRRGSSLVYMCDKLIQLSKHPFSGFFLDNVSELILKIEELKRSRQKTLLIGVSYALMDLSDKNVFLNDNFIVMETGGMKGTRKELLKQELHAYLKQRFRVQSIHSEYGMTELLSQAYSLGDGTFQTPPWMKFLIREVDDPLKLRNDNKTGGINVIDLANIHSCGFIATKDLGIMNSENKLELMGRYDHSDVRGCNLMLGNY